MHEAMKLRFVLGFGIGLGAACGGGGGFPDARPVDTPPTAKFSVAWSVIDQNSQPLACSRIDGQNMTVLEHNKAFVGGDTQIFTCNTGAGTSQDVYAGFFDFDFELSSATFGTLATAPSQKDVEVPAGSITPLTPLVFQVEALGNVSLQLSAAGGNCGGGAGINAFSISVTRNSDNTCVPVSFAISAGSSGGTAGTYATSCTSPADYSGCLYADQVLSATSVASDGYTIHIKGKTGGANCYVNNDALQVPPLQKTLTRTLNLAQTTPGC
jgi:hypothetical protein